MLSKMSLMIIRVNLTYATHEDLPAVRSWRAAITTHTSNSGWILCVHLVYQAFH